MSQTASPASRCERLCTWSSPDGLRLSCPRPPVVAVETAGCTPLPHCCPQGLPSTRWSFLARRSYVGRAVVGAGCSAHPGPLPHVRSSPQVVTIRKALRAQSSRRELPRALRCLLASLAPLGVGGPHSGRHRALLMVASTGMGAACTWSSCPLRGGCCAVKTCLRPRSQRGLCAGMKLGLSGCPWTFILGWYLGHSRHGLWSGPGPGWWGWEGVGQAHTRTDQARAHFLNRGVSSPVWHYWCARWGESGSKLD